MAIATEFTPWSSLAGGMLIGAAAVGLMLVHGRVAGVSGIIVRAIAPLPGNDSPQALSFLFGLAAAPALFSAATRQPVAQTVTDAPALAIVAGLLVGFGAVLGGGCTSGHGVCGLSRFSARSLVATIVFMSVAAITVFVMRHVVGGS